MIYRIVKKASWWTSIFDTERPQFLYYDFRLERFEVACYCVVREHKWEFTKEEVEALSKDYDLESEFFVETVRRKEVKNDNRP